MHVQVIAGGTPVAEHPITGPLSVGRQSVEKGEPGPYALLPPNEDGVARLIVAASDNESFSRKAVLLKEVSDAKVRVSNPSKRPVILQTPAAQRLEPGATADLTMPANVVFPGGLVLRLTADDGFSHLASRSLAPSVAARSRLPSLPALSGSQLDELVRWMQHTMAVFQSTLSSADFIPAAVEALVNILRLDNGRVFLLRGGEWEEAARFPATAKGMPPSQTVLDRVTADKHVFWKVDQREAAADASVVLRQLATVVAAPILDANERVVGVLYGEKQAWSSRPSVGKPEALLVEMLACGIATGLSRQGHEEKARQAEERFAQFFSPALAAELARNPELLNGRGEQVSMLFADVRGFSRVSEQLPPAETVRWLGDIVGELSAAVVAEGGVVVDYAGDEVVAMWGAPTAQPDHPERATRAALKMLAALPALSERWADRTGQRCELGIGVSTGPALVGNIGSAHKFKYGALGNTVNLASRVQGLTKFLKLPLLVTADTKDALGQDFIARRVCRARVVNIARPVDLYEVKADDTRGRPEFFRESEAALKALETGRFAEAARTAGGLLGRFPGDGPLQLILSRAANAILEDGKGFDPVWIPPGK